jgi:hypothetical protein
LSLNKAAWPYIFISLHWQSLDGLIYKKSSLKSIYLKGGITKVDKGDCMNCDVCGNSMGSSQGYAVDASEVLSDLGYWVRFFKMFNTPDQIDGKLPDLISYLIHTSSIWVLCEECMSYLSIDGIKPAAAYRELIDSGEPPRTTGKRISIDEAAHKAYSAFETVFGCKSRSLVIKEYIGEIISSRKFSDRLCDYYESNNDMIFEELKNARVRCETCNQVVNAVECPMTATGVYCPKCNEPWLLLLKK